MNESIGRTIWHQGNGQKSLPWAGKANLFTLCICYISSSIQILPYEERVNRCKNHSLEKIKLLGLTQMVDSIRGKAMDFEEAKREFDM